MHIRLAQESDYQKIYELVQTAFLTAQVSDGTEQDFVLMVISLRNFRQINNTYGQPIGDAFLKEVSSFLNHIGPKQNVYRFNGDEFALLFTHVNEAEMKKCVEVIQKRMKHYWKVNDYRIYLSHVIGAVRHLDHLQTIEQISRQL